MVLEKTLESLLDSKEINQSIPKEINPVYPLEGLILKLKLQYFGHLMWTADSLEKTDVWKDRGQKEKRVTEDEMVGWHHWINGHEFEEAPGDGGQWSLACCSPWGCKELNMTEWLNNNKLSMKRRQYWGTVLCCADENCKLSDLDVSMKPAYKLGKLHYPNC